MIGKTFQLENIKTVEFGVYTKTKEFFSVPIDDGIQAALTAIVVSNIGDLSNIDGDWEQYSVSEEYGTKKKLLVPLADELMAPVRTLFDLKGPEDKSEILQDPKNVDYYFATFWDSGGNKLVALKQNSAFRGTLSKKGLFARLSDTTLELVEGDVFRLETNFDLFVDKEWILIRSHSALEHIANLKASIAAAAKSKIDIIESSISFVDFGNIRSGIAEHPRTARLVVAISKRTDLHKVQVAEVEAMAKVQNISLKKGSDGKLRPRASEEHKFLEIFDDRRYVSKITGEAIPFLARSRIRTK